MDHDDFRKLALSEMDAVYRLAYHLTQRGQEAADLVQETYLRAFRAADGFQPTAHGIRPWLFKILHNVVHTRASRDHRQRQVLEEAQAMATPSHGSQDEPFTDLSNLNWEEVDERLKQAIDALPLPHRTAFLLCAVEGLRYREIADVMDVPVGTVMSRLHRARTLLSNQLTGLAAERGMKSGRSVPRLNPDDAGDAS